MVIKIYDYLFFVFQLKQIIATEKATIKLTFNIGNYMLIFEEIVQIFYLSVTFAK